jgi:hypothetical protein
LRELELEETMAAEFEIIDLDPQQEGSRTVNRWVDGQRFSFRTRVGMALFHDTRCRSFFLAAGESVALDWSFPSRTSFQWIHFHATKSCPTAFCAGVSCSSSHLCHRPGWKGESALDEA